MATFPEYRARKKRKEIEGDYEAWAGPLKNRISLEEYAAAARHHQEERGAGAFGEAFDSSLAFANETSKARETQDERSRAARRVDSQRRAPVTTVHSTWASDPRRWDFPGVDTPRGANLLEELGGRPAFLDVGLERDQ